MKGIKINTRSVIGLLSMILSFAAGEFTAPFGGPSDRALKAEKLEVDSLSKEIVKQDAIISEHKIMETNKMNICGNINGYIQIGTATIPIAIDLHDGKLWPKENIAKKYSGKNKLLKYNLTYSFAVNDGQSEKTNYPKLSISGKIKT